MSKNKLERFAENRSFSNLFQPDFYTLREGFPLKGKWATDHFKNTHPLVLELGCGKGEYTTGLARVFPENNFIGVDVKGARLWRGCKTALEENILNAAFVRTRIEQIEFLFDKAEVSEIWLTFPDPQPRGSRSHKRLMSPEFLKRYRNILTDNAIIHLKTDSRALFDYAMEVATDYSFPILHHTADLYQSGLKTKHYGIQTFYEKMFRDQGIPICYLSFRYVYQLFDEKG